MLGACFTLLPSRPTFTNTDRVNLIRDTDLVAYSVSTYPKLNTVFPVFINW